MGLAPLSRYRASLACPRCRSPLGSSGALRCVNADCGLSAQPFLQIGEHPVLVDFDASVMSAAELAASAGSSPLERAGGFLGALKRQVTMRLEAPNDVAATTVGLLLELVHAPDTKADHDNGPPAGEPHRPTILVIGGGEIGFGLEALYDAPDVDVLAFDIYVSSVTQFVADAHCIPLLSGSVDAVIIQAVLEHVVEPWTVVSEIHRVLRPDGLVYSDVPFLFAVHEGPYDFTRFTDSGHRALYKDFAVISSGAVRGSGTHAWHAIVSFVDALTRSKGAGWAIRILTAWIPRLDRFLDPKWSLDAASSVYLLGRKSNVRATPRQIVEYYQGQQVPPARN